MPTPKVGQVLWAAPNGNKRSGATPKAVTVKSVGRKYFVVGPADNDSKHMQDECYLGSWQHRSDTSPAFDLYESEVAYQNQVSANKLRDRLRNLFTSYGDTDIPVWKLRSIAQTLGILE